MDALLAPGLLDHNPIPNQPAGIEGFKEWMSTVTGAFPDFHGSEHNQRKNSPASIYDLSVLRSARENFSATILRIDNRSEQSLNSRK